jgi:hypothetical protein
MADRHVHIGMLDKHGKPVQAAKIEGGGLPAPLRPFS